jgi:hypothetical protein
MVMLYILGNEFHGRRIKIILIKEWSHGKKRNRCLERVFLLFSVVPNYRRVSCGDGEVNGEECADIIVTYDILEMSR